MGLKCSMFGHSFGDPEVERERDENGDEVVVTVREIEVCSRCGTESVVSENKEVTTLREPSPETDADVADVDDTDDEQVDDDASADEPPTPEVDAGDDAELIGEDDPVFDDVDRETEGDADEDEDDAVEDEDDAVAPDPEEDDDAAIIDAESGEPPTSDDADDEATEDDDAEADPPVATPEDLLPGDATADADETDPDASGDPDDGVILDEAETEATAERNHGEWPESEDVGPPADDAAATGTEPAVEEATVDTGIASAGRAPAPDAAPGDATGAELFCPSCSYTASLERASLRVGDICPECKRGYLSKR